MQIGQPGVIGMPGIPIPRGMPGIPIPGGMPGIPIPGGMPGIPIPGGMPGIPIPGGMPGIPIPGGMPGISIPEGITGINISWSGHSRCRGSSVLMRERQVHFLQNQVKYSTFSSDENSFTLSYLFTIFIRAEAVCAGGKGVICDRFKYCNVSAHL
jgi:hypothetical protein